MKKLFLTLCIIFTSVLPSIAANTTLTINAEISDVKILTFSSKSTEVKIEPEENKTIIDFGSVNSFGIDPNPDYLVLTDSMGAWYIKKDIYTLTALGNGNPSFDITVSQPYDNNLNIFISETGNDWEENKGQLIESTPKIFKENVKNGDEIQIDIGLFISMDEQPGKKQSEIVFSMD
jgi:hypothetical protein